jgi:hypothetical protein
MNTHVRAEALAQQGPLAFTPGNGVQDSEVKAFCVTVNKNAKAVSLGIVQALKQEGVQAQAKEVTPGNWSVTVGTARDEASADLRVDANITANITLTANTNDVPLTINALNQFFGNWYAVAGLIATGAAFVTGVWILRVNRRP